MRCVETADGISESPSFTLPAIEHNASTAPAPASDQAPTFSSSASAQSKYHRACNQYGHSRSSSKACPLYKPALGKAPPAPPDDAPPETSNIRGKWTEEHTAYKCGFRKMLNTLPPENTVHNVANQVTQTCYQASRLLQLHIQRIIENN
ncbi:hypothetical protein NQZ79_g1514 [Umbelopsis isabellina]|nr:hypothetical protein NQZ79_g1514 [Umbelopsis isabellina]